MSDILTDFSDIAEVLWQEQTRYAVVGGVAVMIHGSIRTTQDIDFLVHPEDVDRVVERLKRRGYNETQGAWTFRDSQLTLRRVWRKSPEGVDATIVDFLIAGLPRHFNIIKRAKLEPWEGKCEVRVATKSDLIWMKSFRKSATDEQDMDFLKHGKLPHDFPG
jgi:hypothetical protein